MKLIGAGHGLKLETQYSKSFENQFDDKTVMTKMGYCELDPLQYSWPTYENDQLNLNELIGKPLKIHFTGKLECLHCGDTSIKKIYHDGYCFKCFLKLPQCDSCIMQPELCHFHLGTCRDSEWGKLHCMKEHFVYISYTSSIKVGLTKRQNLPSRWIDSGATLAQVMFKVTTRREAGVLETLMKDFFSDTTKWQMMLKLPNPPSINTHLEHLLASNFYQEFLKAKETLAEECSDHLEHFVDQFGEDHLEVCSEQDYPQTLIHYPVKEGILQGQKGLKSLSFTKTPTIEGILLGIKGQYLIFDENRVLNIRKHSGHFLEFSVEL
jgi:hypothetical protein